MSIAHVIFNYVICDLARPWPSKCITRKINKVHVTRQVSIETEGDVDVNVELD